MFGNHHLLLKIIFPIISPKIGKSKKQVAVEGLSVIDNKWEDFKLLNPFLSDLAIYKEINQIKKYMRIEP